MASLGTSPKKPKGVTHVSGIICYPSLGMGTPLLVFLNSPVSEKSGNNLGVHVKSPTGWVF